MADVYQQMLERSLDDLPETIEKKIDYIANHYRANTILHDAAKYAKHPEAQQFVAKAADFQMDRNNQMLGRSGLKFANPNKDYKPSLPIALDALIKAGTLTTDNISPELRTTIKVFRDRYPSEEISTEVRQIFDAVDPSTFTEKIFNRYSPPKVIR
jgi:hypothetical protein